MSSNKKCKKIEKNYELPSFKGVDIKALLEDISIKEKQTNTPPAFTLEIGFPADNIEKQLKSQKVNFDPSCIKKYDKLIKSIVDLKNEDFISKNQSEKLIYKVYARSINHVYFIYEMI